jgi:phosphoribosylformylglycinamidine cyclo-ligase
MHADGAGTKSSLAYIYWKETGDLGVFKDIAMDSLAMNLDDLACAGAVGRYLLSNTIGRNKFLIPGEVIKTIIDGYNDAIDVLSHHGIDIDFCGGETADVGDLVKTLIVDSTVTARMKRSEVIDLDTIQPGDCIIGFASSGQSAWETKFNSGIGSNGLTAARHDSLNHHYADKYPESFSPDMPVELAYCGSGELTQPLDGTTLNLGQALLSPTRSYTPLIKKILQALPGKIHGMIHCSGGGQTKCLKFGKSIHYIKNNLFPIPAIFNFLMKTRNISLQEMYPVFNMGHRLELFVDESDSAEILKIAKACNIDAQIIGHCEKSTKEGNQLTICSEGQKIIF